MPFPAALDSTQKGYIRASSYRAAQYIAFCPNTAVFVASVNGTPTGNSFAQVTFDNVTTGAYTDIEIGQTVYIDSDGSLTNPVFVGRVRKTPTSTILYINETSAAILDNYIITVADDYRLAEKLARVVGTAYYKDWDLTFAQPSPIIAGLQNAYIGVVSGSPSGYTIAFTASALAVTSGATISTYAWDVSDGTVTAGSISTASVTVRFPSGFRWISLAVTDSGGRVTTRRIPIWAVPTDFSSVVSLGLEGAEINADIDSGHNASIAAFEGISSVLDQTLCVVFDVELYGSTETAIVTSVKFIGRLRKDIDDNTPDDTASRVQSTRFEIEGMGSQLSSLSAPSIKIINDSTPTVWDEIKDLTFWRACCHLLQTHTTFLSISSLSFDDTSNTYRYPSFPTQGSSIWDVLQDFLESINGAMQFASSGEAKISRDARYLTSTERNALVTVLDFEMQDVLSLSLEHDEVEQVGQVKAYGGTFSSTTNKETIVAAFWPGMAQGSGQGREVLNRQVLAANVTKAAAQTELNQRIGYKAAISNTLDRLNIEFPDGYNWIVPAVDQWYTFTIAADDTLRGFVFDDSIRWLCESVSVNHDNAAGGKSVSATFIKETASTDGKTYNPPAPTAITPSLPSFPPFNAYPSFPDLPILLPDGNGSLPYLGITNPITTTPPTDGNTGLAVTENDLFVTTELLRTATPDAFAATPTLESGATIRHAIWSSFGKDAYCLASDGTDSIVYYNANIFDNGNNWISSGVQSGVYDLLRPTATQGSVLAYGIDTTGWTYTFDFTVSDGGFTVAGYGTYTPGVGWTETAAPAGSAINVTRTWVTSTTILSASITVTFGGAGGGRNVSVRDDGHAVVIVDGVNVPAGTGTYSGSGTFTNVTQVTMNPSAGTGVYDSITITSLTLTGTGTNPFTGLSSGNSRVIYSTDYAASFTTAYAVGAPPSMGGVDTSKIGTQVIASGDGQTYKATFGGAFTSYGGTKTQGALLIPRRQFGGTTGNTGTTPQYLLASNVSDGGESLWKVTASGATFTAITPNDGSADGLAVSPNCLAMNWLSGSIILALLAFGSDVKLAVSTNSGTSWTFTSALDAAALSVRIRKGDTTNRQAFIANGTSGVGYISNYRAGTITVTPKLFPTEDPIIYYEPFG